MTAEVHSPTFAPTSMKHDNGSLAKMGENLILAIFVLVIVQIVVAVKQRLAK